MSYFTIYGGSGDMVRLSGISANTCRPHCPAGYKRYARDEKHCLGPRQYPIATHVAPQSLDCPKQGGLEALTNS